jgi:hypothetical protein
MRLPKSSRSRHALQRPRRRTAHDHGLALARYEGESRLRSIAATLRLRSSGNPHPGLTAGATDLAPAHAGSDG